MPEVKLGINPGAGGTQRLPRVIGLQAALRMLLSGDPLDPQQAQDAGLGDSICPPEAWLDNARKILTSTAPRRKTDQRTDRIKDAQANTTAAEASAIDHAMVEFGMAMGPLVLNDMAGMDIFVQTDALLRRAFPYHGEPADIAVRLVQQGHLGQKTGSGVYRYEKGNRAPLPSLTTAQALTEVRQEQGRSPRPISAAEITERLVLRMVNEAFHVLEEGLCQRSSDLDVAMVLGTGLADFRGGVVKYAQDVGPDHVRTQLQKLAAQHGERFAPCQLLFSRKP
jgi:3-hydroxyacyl-CoA dehydrogenase